MTSIICLVWPTSADQRLRAEIHRVLHAVADRGGAIGYALPPARAEADVWLDGILDLVASGDAALVLATVNGRVEATGLWRRGSKPFFTHYADLEKIMAHPAVRGLRLGQRITQALINSARQAGIETLALGVRGNNHGAIELYEQLGFREWGRLPNVIEVGDERYDDIRMFLDLGRQPNVVLRGSGPGGAGASPRRTIPADSSPSTGSAGQ